MVVRSRNPVFLPLFIGIFILLSVTGGWVLFDYGRHRAGYDSMQAEEAREGYRHSLEQLQNQISTLRGELVHLKSGKDIDALANEEIKNTLVSLQQDNQELREELQFYRSIVSPSRGRPGVHIHNFKLTQGEKAGHYYYNITLVHIQGLSKHHRRVKGVVKLEVEGEQDGVVKKLSLADLTSPRKSNIRFTFKYFNRFEGELVLPKGFSPKNLLLKADSTTTKINGDEKRMAWPNSAIDEEDNQDAG
jgi:hypothetical protein